MKVPLFLLSFLFKEYWLQFQHFSACIIMALPAVLFCTRFLTSLSLSAMYRVLLSNTMAGLALGSDLSCIFSHVNASRDKTLSVVPLNKQTLSVVPIHCNGYEVLPNRLAVKNNNINYLDKSHLFLTFLFWHWLSSALELCFRPQCQLSLCCHNFQISAPICNYEIISER